MVYTKHFRALGLPNPIVRGVPEWHRAVPTAALDFSLWYRVPAEVEFPVEASPRHVGACDVLKRLVTDHVNDRAHHSRPKKTCIQYLQSFPHLIIR